MNGLKYVRPGNGFVPAFPLSDKTEVNGLHEHKLFTYLKVRTIYVDVLRKQYLAQVSICAYSDRKALIFKFNLLNVQFEF